MMDTLLESQRGRKIELPQGYSIITDPAMSATARKRHIIIRAGEDGQLERVSERHFPTRLDAVSYLFRLLAVEASKQQASA